MENQGETVCSMYLGTIPNLKRKFTHDRSGLDVSDIQGARSRFVEHPRPERDCSMKTYDIDKSRPKQLIPEVVNKPSYLLQIDDIAGTRTKVNKFTTTRRTNPLEPAYQSPKVECTLCFTEDIEGVRSRQTFANRIERAGKKINTKQDLLLFIKPTMKGFNRVRTTIDFALKVDDINKGPYYCGEKVKRQTNPLEPKYNIAGEKGYGQIEGSKRVVKNNGLPLRQSNSLLTGDIEGAKPKVNNFVCDKKDEVAGSKPQSLKRGISSNRKTNPLQPRYDYPGWSENNASCEVFTRPKTAVQRLDAFIK